MNAKEIKNWVVGVAGLLLLGLLGCQSGESIGSSQAKLVDGPSFRLTPSTNSVTPGQPFHLTIEALDAEGQVNSEYAGTIHFSSSDAEAILPSDRTMSPATHGILQIYYETSLHNGGTQTIIVTDADHPENTGSTDVMVNSAGLAFSIETASSAISGESLSVTVQANDSSNTVRTNYVGTVHFSSSDANAVLPQNYTFTSNDAGVHTFTVQLLQAGAQTITVVDTQDATSTATAEVQVTNGPVTHFNLQASSSSVSAGDLIHLYVTALDANNNLAPNYLGTVTFASSDTNATLPTPATFGENQSSISLFYATRLVTAGSQTITVSDQTNSAISGTTSVAVARGAASKLGIATGNTTVEKDSTFSITVRVEDAYGNLINDATGTILLSSTDSMATFPASYDLQAEDLGQHSFDISLTSTGSQNMYADLADSSLARGSLSLQVVPPPSSGPHIIITPYENPVMPGVASHLMISVVDAEGQPLSNYSGTIHFTSNDATAVLPSDYTFSPEYPTISLFYSFSFPNGGLKTITATDTQNASMQGSTQIFIGGGDS